MNYVFPIAGALWVPRSFKEVWGTAFYYSGYHLALFRGGGSARPEEEALSVAVEGVTFPLVPPPLPTLYAGPPVVRAIAGILDGEVTLWGHVDEDAVVDPGGIHVSEEPMVRVRFHTATEFAHLGHPWAPRPGGHTPRVYFGLDFRRDAPRLPPCEYIMGEDLPGAQRVDFPPAEGGPLLAVNRLVLPCPPNVTYYFTQSPRVHQFVLSGALQGEFIYLDYPPLERRIQLRIPAPQGDHAPVDAPGECPICYMEGPLVARRCCSQVICATCSNATWRACPFCRHESPFPLAGVTLHTRPDVPEGVFVARVGTREFSVSFAPQKDLPKGGDAVGQ